MATHSSVLAWEILWSEEPDGLQFHGVAKEAEMTTKQQQRFPLVDQSQTLQLILYTAVFFNLSSVMSCQICLHNASFIEWSHGYLEYLGHIRAPPSKQRTSQARMLQVQTEVCAHCQPS